MESFTDINLKMTRDNADKKKGKKGDVSRDLQNGTNDGH